MNTLKDIWDLLGGLNSMPYYALTFLLCIVCGYVVRAIKQIHNEAIPALCVAWGAVWNLFLADPWTPPMNMRLWVAKNVAIGMIIGCFAWLAHRNGIKKLESRFKFLRGSSGDSDPVAFIKPVEPPKE